MIRILCQDKYETQKLFGLINTVDKDESLLVQVLDVFDDEVILQIKDESAHSVLFKNKTEAERFVDFIQSITEKEHKITNVEIIQDVIEITKQ
ncbi:MAG: hypothetical protein R1F52_04905 [Candidatus Nitrosoabyssus spongiisocia]|nr:MAG: hypothetical protein R1F52_04905 [Nitrosopumilaceae archaeon AB1(1)]